ncbi:acyltransferase [Butyrivibrio sp. NC3005]|uniref:acyltransferase n=1 Tax=Butyrivibrio sp. NC3005 TaxID=1280685 RepID=UPI0018C9CC44|nr:acyltransferase [Butyrivibrio sp. NC3005]
MFSKIRKSKAWYKLGLIYLDLGYMLLNTFINHIPAWWIRRLLYKLSGLKMGRKCRIGYGTIIVRPHNITLGEGCIINEFCYLDGRGGIIIEDNSSISVFSRIISASHDLQSEDFAYQDHQIKIHDHVFLGAGATVLEGSELDSGCVVGAGAVAKGHLEANTIYYGNPLIKGKKREISNTYELYHEAFFR